MDLKKKKILKLLYFYLRKALNGEGGGNSVKFIKEVSEVQRF